MDTKYFKILSALHHEGVGHVADISPVLKRLYRGANEEEYQDVSKSIAAINALLRTMDNEGLIVVKGTSFFGNGISGWSTPFNMSCEASITSKGFQEIEIENAKSDAARLAESTMLTNESVRETNASTIQNMQFQKRSQVWQIVLAGVSTLFIAVTVWQSCTDKTSTNLEKLESQLKQQKEATQQLKKSLDEINTTLKERIDTAKVRVN